MHITDLFENNNRNTPISELPKPLYIGEYTNAVGKLNMQRRVFVGTVTKKNTVELYGSPVYLQKVADLINNMFNVVKPIASIGQGYHGTVLDISSITVADFESKLNKIYSVLSH